MEKLRYDYSPADSSPERPLSILNHLGGDPLMALVGRSQTTVKDYQLVVKWIKIFAAHGEKILLAKHPDSEEPLKIFHKDFVPLLQRFSESTEKLWLPALADGQQALVLDSKWSSKRWQAMMPESQIPLPMLELGLVLGVSDSEKFEEALGEYRLIANEFWKKIREVEGGNFLPEFAIPRPEVERKGGKIFAHYPIPEASGLDEKFLPTGGLTKSFAALSLSRKHTDRLLTDNPLHAATTLLSDPNRPLDAVFYVNWAELLDVAPPWLKYVHEMHDGDENAEKMEQTARKIIKVLQVFRSYTSITYREKGATVTHSEGIFKDLRASDRR